MSNADHLAANVLIVGSVLALFVGMVTVALVAAWETHVATAPGFADAEIEACDLAMWELEGSYPQVYDAEDFGGPA